MPPDTVVVIDTAPVIAYLEGSLDITPAAAVVFDEWIVKGRNNAVLSAITVAELLVGPKRSGSGLQPLRDFLLTFPNLRCVDVTVAIADDAATVRASTPIKMPDALIIATATNYNAHLITNDFDWEKYCPSSPIATLQRFVTRDP